MSNVHKRNPYVNGETEVYVTAINILAVEFLIKTRDEERYGHYCDIVNKLDDYDLELLRWELTLNMHTSSLGAMITHSDYDEQRDNLLYFLDHLDEKRAAMKIIIDFDIKDESGNKSFEKNLEQARKWPPTYAELNKSGNGIHLHYIYSGKED